MAQQRSTRAQMALIGLAHAAITALTWRDLRRRPDGEVRGRKNLWRAASTLNTGGSVAYWLFGRKRQP